MSTILDALRKVEQDNRERNADARARLLSLPLHTYDYPARQKRPSLLLGASLAVVGFLVGGSLMYTRLQPIQANQMYPNLSANQQLIFPPALHKPTPVSQSPQPSHLSTAPSDQAAAPFVPPPKPGSPPQTVAMVPQRSPFVSAAPHVQSVQSGQPSSHQLASRSDPEYVIEPLEPDFWSDTLPEYEQDDQPGQALKAEQTERDAQFIAPPPDPPLATSTAPARPSQASLGLLQWSSEPDKRFAFIKIKDGPLTMVYEGDSVGGFTVVAIRKDSVELRSGGAHGDILTLYSR